MYSSKFGEVGGKLKEEFLDNETQCFLYLLDMVATVKVARTRTEHLQTKFRLSQVYVCLFAILPCFVTFHPELKEYISNIENVHCVYYNKVLARHHKNGCLTQVKVYLLRIALRSARDVCEVNEVKQTQKYT